MVVSRHYARVGARLVHYRLAGGGPPVVLVHQSPRSAAEYLPLIAVWAKDFTVIAPDTPGNGQSDPLALAAPGIPDYAEALLAFLDTLGIEKAGFYGYHTGAATVACLAHQAPARMVAGVANGFAIMQDAERKDFLAHYLPAVPPAWDGSHLAWAWARIREQSVFFPWYRRHDDARLAYDAYTPEAAQEHVMDMLRPGDAYRAPYRAAFAFERERCFDGPTAPLTIMAAPPDPLFAHLDRLGALPETVSVYRGRDRNDALARARAILRRALANARLGAPGPTPTPRLREAARPGRGYANLETGRQIHFRHSAWSKSRPVMILHDIGLSSRVVEADCAALAQTRPVLAPDLPGHGASDPRTQLAPEAIAAWLLAMLDALDINSIDLVCHGFAAAIGLNMTRQAPQQIGRCVLVDAYWPLDAAMREKLAKRHFPDRSPNAHGGHLLAAWRFLRGRALFWPWFDERRTTIIPTQESALEPNALQHALIGFFEAPPWAEGLLRACLDTDLAAAGTDLAERIGWLCPDWTIARTELWRPDATRHGAVAGYDNRDMAARNQALRQLLDSGNQ